MNYFDLNIGCLRTVVSPVMGVGVKWQEIPIEQCKPDLECFREVFSKYSTPYMPSGAFCNPMLKTYPYNKYVKAHYGKDFVSFLGIRADEPKRLKARPDAMYLADLSDWGKPQILDWWKEQPFDLDIPPHSGNCVFCIKKTPKQVGEAAYHNPELAAQWQAMLLEDTVRVTDRKCPVSEMYTGAEYIWGLYPDVH